MNRVMLMKGRALNRALSAALALMLMVPVSSMAAFADEDGGSLTGTPVVEGDDEVAQEEVVDVIASRSGLAAGIYYFQSASRSMNMIAGVGKNVQVGIASGKPNQQWALIVGKDGYAKLKNVKSGKVLSVVGATASTGALVGQLAEKAASDEDAAGSVLAQENLGQKWIVKKSGKRYRFLSALDPTFALVVKGSKASGYHIGLGSLVKGRKTQLFSAVKPSGVKRAIASRNSIAAGSYYIQSDYLPTQVLDVAGSNVRLATTDGSRGQRWKLKVGRDGYAKLFNGDTGKVLAVKGAKAKNGANVCQAAEKTAIDVDAAGSVLAQENLDQKWIARKRGGRLLLLSALDRSYALHIAAKGKKGVCNAELRKRSDADRQLFSFVPAKPKAAKKGKYTVSNGVYLLSPNANATQAVSVEGFSEKTGANAEMSAFSANVAQTFRVVYDKRGYYTLTNVKSGKRLAPVAACSVPETNVAQYASKTSDRVKWRIDRYSGGYRLVNKATGLALAMADPKHPDGVNICATTPKKGEAAQRFSFVRPSDKSPKASQVKGVFYIAMKSNSKSVVGIRDDSRMEGISVNVRARRNTNVQRFAIKSAGKGAYYVQNVATQRVLSLERQSKAKNVNVVTRWKNAKSYQKWKIVYNDDFSYAFVNAYSGMHLHVSGASVAENTNVKVFSAKAASPAQQFRLLGTAKRTDEQVEINVPCYFQNPELPTGCESVALTNALRYWGFGLSKTEIADRWMPYGSDGVYNFIGNPRNSSGWIICAPGIANTANSYSRSRGSNVRAKVVKGASLSSLREYLDRGEPVVVWTTIGMGYPGAVQWWNNGYPLRSNNHAVVLCGYNPRDGYYRVSDSLAGIVWRNGSSFEWLFNEMGRQAVVIYR